MAVAEGCVLPPGAFLFFGCSTGGYTRETCGVYNMYGYLVIGI